MSLDTGAPMACRLCAVPLNRYVEADTGLVTYTHPQAAAVEDADGHAPDPAPISEVDARHLCDFCSDERIVYVLQTAPITAAIVTAGQRLLQQYGTTWSACFQCIRFIDARDVDGLQSRLRHVTAQLDQVAAGTVRTMQQAVLDSLLPGKTVAAIGRWPATPVAAATMPKVRDRLAAMLASPVGLPLGLDAQDIRHPLADSLHAARLFWIDAQFTELAKHAARALPDTAVTAVDLPAPHGLLAWAKPVGQYADVVAASWTTDSGGLRIVGYRSIGSGLPAAELQDLRTQLGWLTPRIHTHLGPGRPPEPGSLAAVLIATWLLIAQRIAETTEAAVEKAIRKAHQRTGRPTPQVRLVRIRGSHLTAPGTPRQDFPADQDRPQREFRWWVRGHWRHQPYGPGRTQRRLIYVDPQLRGPADKPIKASTTVRTLFDPSTRGRSEVIGDGHE